VQKEGHPACKNVWVMVCLWCQCDWSFARLVAPVVTTTSIIVILRRSNRIQNGDILVPVLANPDCPEKWQLSNHRHIYQHCFDVQYKPIDGFVDVDFVTLSVIRGNASKAVGSIENRLVKQYSRKICTHINILEIDN